MANYFRDRIEFPILLASLALVAAGLVSVYSATFDARMAELFAKQVVAAGVGVFLLIVASLLPLRTLQLISIPAYFLSLLSLVTVLLIGKQVSGSTSWFNLGPMSVQPSEFAKIATILALASYLQQSDVSLQKTKDLLIAGAIIGAPVLLVLKQPDTGTALTFVGMFIPVLYWGGAKPFTLVALIAPGVVAVTALLGPTPFLIGIIALGILIFITKQNWITAAVVFSIVVFVGISVQSIHDNLRPYQQKRIATFLDPSADPLGAGYNVLQSKVAIGSGGLLGKGFLKGTQTRLNFIPAQWTDFIFTVPGEEFGMLGATIVLILFMVLLFRGIRIATTVKNSYGSFVAVGIVGIFATHIFVNIGMALGLVPVIGVPLPFLSYGGSALLANMIMIGLLLNLYANRKEY
ncbi:MAG: rod shape-determining protein RodA [Ignavibacteriae bacterium]|nr:rod shape-determining protein RodA [Ignavibacteriota bacterium]